MLNLEAQLFGLTAQAWFPKAIPFPKSNILTISEDIIEKLQPLGLKAPQLELTNKDQLFNYELRLSIFNGNGNFSLTAERLEVSFMNGKSVADLTLIARTLLTFYEAARLPDDHSNAFSAFVHAKPTSDAERAVFFDQYGKRERFVLTGLIASVRVTAWDEDIRVYIDRSSIAPAWMYVHWTTRLVGTRLSETVLGNLRLAIEESARVSGLDFAALN